ncbi:MAG TPA: hypothetical protein VFC43_05305 [Methanoregula sp.]|nr:hypothetical protein [Methanoregula sp.]
MKNGTVPGSLQPCVSDPQGCRNNQPSCLVGDFPPRTGRFTAESRVRPAPLFRYSVWRIG